MAIILSIAIPRELWISNLVDSATAIGDSQRQQLRWLASAAAWERPAELLGELLDDNQLELFLKGLIRPFNAQP